MTQAMPWVFAALASLFVGVIAVSFWQSVRAMLGLVEEGEVAEERFADADRDLLARRAAILASLRDLDFDHEAGKLSDEDHREARLRLRTEAKAVMAALDAAIAPDRARIEREVDARLAGGEPLVASSLAGSEGASATAASTRVPASSELRVTKDERVMRAAAASTPTAPTPPTAPTSDALEGARTCASCAASNDADAAFCKRCGKPLAAEASS